MIHRDKGPGFTHFDSLDCGCQPYDIDAMRAELARLEAIIEDGYWRFSRSTGKGLHLASQETYEKRNALKLQISLAEYENKR